MTEIAADELLEQVRRLARDFPLPHPRWHRFVPLMHTVVDDLTAAVAAIAESPDALAALVRQIDDASPPPAPSGPVLAAASARLAELPLPEGEHPYLDEIRLALEAAGAALAALSSTSDGEQRFEAARSRVLGA